MRALASNSQAWAISSSCFFCSGSFMWVASLRHSSARSLYSDTLRMTSSPWTLELPGKLTTVENCSGERRENCDRLPQRRSRCGTASYGSRRTLHFRRECSLDVPSKGPLSSPNPERGPFPVSPAHTDPANVVPGRPFWFAVRQPCLMAHLWRANPLARRSK